MPIIIKDLLSSDIIGSTGSFTELINKLNFNFDQILINGGGPIGLQGNTGPQGIPGALGKRGNLWFVNDIGPTQTYEGGVLYSGDQLIDTLGNLKTYIEGGIGWTGTGINLKGPTGITGASGANGSVAGFNLYAGTTGATFGIVIDPGDGYPLKPTGATGESLTYTNYAALENRKNLFYLGDIQWAANYFKNFGVAYNPILSKWQGFYESGGPKPSKLVVIQDQVDYFSNHLMSFGAYGLTSVAGSATYGYELGASSTDTNFLDFVNFGFTTETLDSSNRTKFKLSSRKIPFYIKAGGPNPAQGEAAADITLTANNINLSTYNSGSIKLANTLVVSAGSTFTGLATFTTGMTAANLNTGGLTVRNFSYFNGIANFNSGLTASNIQATFSNIKYYKVQRLDGLAHYSVIASVDSNNIVNIDPNIEFGNVKIGSSSGVSNLFVTGTFQSNGLGTFLNGLSTTYLKSSQYVETPTLNIIDPGTSTSKAAMRSYDSNILNLNPTGEFNHVQIGSYDYNTNLVVTGDFSVGGYSYFSNGIDCASYIDTQTLSVLSTAYFNDNSIFYAGLTSVKGYFGGLTAGNLVATGATVTEFKNAPTFSKGLTSVGGMFSGSSVTFLSGLTVSGGGTFSNNLSVLGILNTSSDVNINGTLKGPARTTNGVTGTIVYGYGPTVTGSSTNFLNFSVGDTIAIYYYGSTFTSTITSIISNSSLTTSDSATFGAGSFSYAITRNYTPLDIKSTTIYPADTKSSIGKSGYSWWWIFANNITATDSITTDKLKVENTATIVNTNTTFISTAKGLEPGATAIYGYPAGLKAFGKINGSGVLYSGDYNVSGSSKNGDKNNGTYTVNFDVNIDDCVIISTCTHGIDDNGYNVHCYSKSGSTAKFKVEDMSGGEENADVEFAVFRL